MIVTANGTDVELTDGATLADLIDVLGLSKRLIVAERNGEAIPRRAIPDTVLCDGDRLELVRAVAGG